MCIISGKPIVIGSDISPVKIIKVLCYLKHYSLFVG